MTHKVERQSVARLTRKRYDAIIAKLLSTAATHKAAFPQLTAIEAFLDNNYTELDTDKNCLEKLDELCLYFQELSVNSYIFRHLYHNLCTDVDAVKNNTPPYDKGSTYIILPE